MLLALIILFLFLSALFSGSEIAFVSANKLAIELKKKKGSKAGKIISGFLEKPSDFLSTMLVGNNIALVVFTTLASVPIAHFLAEYFQIKNELLSLFITTLILTVIILIFGEFLPKTLFKVRANEALLTLAYPLKALEYILLIPSRIMTGLSHFILKYIFKSPVEEGKDVFTRVDLGKFIQNLQADPEEEIDKELFEKALNFKDVKVKECMVPRPEIISIDSDASIEELIAVFKKERKSRIIVFKDDIDNVIGYIHHLQLLKRPKNIKSLIKKIEFVPEVMHVHDLMNTFIKKRSNIACVVDEFGGTAGVITLEDILEEIFGEIEDEHDTDGFTDTKISDTEYLFSARLEIDFLNEKYPDLNFPEGEYHTLSGYIVHTTEAIPEKGDVFELDNKKFIIEEVTDTKIELVRVILT